MSDDPFAEPGDTEATNIRPRPGGRAVPQAAPQAAPGQGTPTVVPTIGANPLIAAAAPVLAAAIRITAPRGRDPDPEQLKRGMVAAVREFEKRALATGRDTQALRAARYALCATVDDLVLSTPWGSRSSWIGQSLTSIFHQEVSGGERFFDILEQMQKDLGRHGDVVELMYLCVCLGFEGRYRVLPRGAAALAELRDGLFRTIRNRRGEFERDLAPHWPGIKAAYRPLGQRVPLWAIGLGTLAMACILYIIFNFSLAATSDVVFAEMSGLPPHGTVVVPRAVTASAPAGQAVPPPPPPPTPVTSTLAPKLRGFLEPEIKAGLVQVFEDAQSVTVRLVNRNMFGSGSAVLNSSYLNLLGRIGAALNDEKGDVLVNGYTDNQPIHTVQFPSNFELSQARANAVAAQIEAKMTDPKRVRAVGKGDADPIETNATPDGRQANRRTDIVLMKTAGLP
jgi:type VI secretion system protein ImpK